MSIFSWMSTILTTLVGGIALFNLARKALDVGLGMVMADLVKYYQDIFYPILDFLNKHIDWMIPEWNKDIIMLIVFIAATNSRSVAYHFFHEFIPSQQKSSAGKEKRNYLYSVKLGVLAPLAFLAGGELVIKKGPNPVFLAIATANVVSFVALLTIALFIPYLRVVVSFLLIVSAAIFLATILGLVETSGVKFTNKKIFAYHYLGAIAGALGFAVLNLYSP